MMRILIAATVSLVLVPPAQAADIDATVHWSRRVELSTPVSGVVARVLVDTGQRVARNELLLALDNTPFKAAVSAAEAAAASRKLDHDEAARDAKQAQELYDRTVLSTVELENAQWKATRAAADLKAARAELEQARYRLRVSSLRAPFDAWVLARQVEAGETVVADLKPPTLIVLVAAGEYQARARLSADKLGSLKPGQAVQVKVAGERYPGTVKAVGMEPLAAGAAKADAYELIVVFAAEAMLRAGQPATVELP